MRTVKDTRPVLVAGGGIGGLAAALALVREGYRVKVIEQAGQIGEIGAGIQLSPNAFAACDALGVGEHLRAKAVYTEEMVMFDAIDAKRVASISLSDSFRERFGNPYAVIHRADIHGALLEGVKATTEGIEFLTSTKVVHIEQDDTGVTLIDAQGGRHEGQAVIGCDGVRSAVRQQYVGDSIRVSGHVVFRAVVDTADFPEALRFTAPCIWVGPNCHLVHYPLKGGDKFNMAVTFHSDQPEEWARWMATRRRCSATSGLPASRCSSCCAFRRRGSATQRPTATPSSNGPSAAPRCWAMRRTRWCSTWRRARAWLAKTR